MPHKRKIEPGRCQACGRAVVKPTDSEISFHFMMKSIDSSNKNDYTITLNGHTYYDTLAGPQLMSVLCFTHTPREEKSWGGMPLY